jgi:hypothetical protein
MAATASAAAVLLYRLAPESCSIEFVLRGKKEQAMEFAITASHDAG